MATILSAKAVPELDALEMVTTTKIDGRALLPGMVICDPILHTPEAFLSHYTVLASRRNPGVKAWTVIDVADGTESVTHIGPNAKVRVMA